ncbi:MAG: preprotein translocase subunit SecD, partial [Kribbellaceae bacterium]|nr:preprotein translocase subunit SecD [Kribbellaceae bacterium]
MATTTTSRPGRNLIVLAVILVLLFGIMAIAKTWAPKLGLDLRGGTTVTLTASNFGRGGDPTAEQLSEAKNIISQRVNGAGVGEAEVATSGKNHITVSVPGANQDALVKQVGQTALLNFRIVYDQQAGQPLPPAPPSATPTGKPSTTPKPTTTPKPASTIKPSSPATPNGRAWSSVLGAATPTPTPKASTPTTKPSTPATPTPSTIPGAPVTGDPLAWKPDPATTAAFATFVCEKDKPLPLGDDKKPLFSCSKDYSTKYLLGPAILQGTDLSDASAAIPQNGVNWQVNLKFTSDGGDKFLKATTAIAKLTPPSNLFAIVLDGVTISTPTVSQPIPGGQAQITGSFTETEARDLGNVLKYGALPVAFDTSSVETVSAQLGGDQLSAGITAGLIGLALVVLFSFLYYRGLGLVVVMSLMVAGALTYASVVLLGKTMGFALTLSGIAGLIVAIGITADSFVI